MHSRWFWLGGAGLVALQALALWLMGQPALCECGYIKLWEGVVLGPGNSQHLADWYTFSHFIHGLLFYWLLTLVAPKLSVAARLLLALGVEVGWEVLENTPWLVDHYRQQALAQGYTGDSIINSISDSVVMMLGFVAAWRLPVWGSVVLALGLKSVSLWFIRDGLVLNVVNLLHHFNFIDQWQADGH
ncbi:MAG TPA: DUF2585 family protein [Candidatus Paceibacterota bacterium]